MKAHHSDMKFSDLLTSQVSAPRLIPQFQARECDNVLPDHCRRTPLGAELDEYGAIVTDHSGRAV
jgi:hypothetical protein